MTGLVRPLAVCPPDEVTVYEVIAVPPSEAGAVNETEAWPLPGVAVTPVGAPGATGVEPGTTAFDAAEAEPRAGRVRRRDRERVALSVRQARDRERAADAGGRLCRPATR